MEKSIKAYKGFNRDMTCNPDGIPFQYEKWGEYENENGANACHYGFHACENPLDTLRYYSPDKSIYHEVELSGEIDRSEQDKICASKIRIGASINIAGVVKAGIQFVKERATEAFTSGYGANAATSGIGANAATSGSGANAATSGDRANAATSGNRANAATSGDRANAATSGIGANAATSGNRANAATSGDRANAATSGNRANAATSGSGANAATSGIGANAATSGNRANAATSGRCAAAVCSGYKGSAIANDPTSIAVAWGFKSKAKGVKGTFLVFAEWDGNEESYWDFDELKLKGAKMVKVDGIHIKENTWYCLENEELKEVIDNED